MCLHTYMAKDHVCIERFFCRHTIIQFFFAEVICVFNFIGTTTTDYRSDGLSQNQIEKIFFQKYSLQSYNAQHLLNFVE